jgi:hypothetical protein
VRQRRPNRVKYESLAIRASGVSKAVTRGMAMNFPVRPEDVKIIQGRSKGLQVMCSCGCINFNYLDPQETTWRCRNCQRVLSDDFPRLLEKALALQKQEQTAPGGALERGSAGARD